MAAVEVIDADGPTYWDYIAMMSSFAAALAFNELKNSAGRVRPAWS